MVGPKQDQSPGAQPGRVNERLKAYGAEIRALMKELGFRSQHELLQSLPSSVDYAPEIFGKMLRGRPDGNWYDTINEIIAVFVDRISNNAPELSRSSIEMYVKSRIFRIDREEINATISSLVAGKFICRNFSGSVQAFGEFDRLWAEIKRLEEQNPIPDCPGNDMGGVDQWLELYNKSPETFCAILQDGASLVAFWHVVAVNDAFYRKAVSGVNVNKDMKSNDVLNIDIPGTYKMYFVDLFVDEEKRNPAVFGQVRNSIIEFFIAAAENGVFFDRIAANVSSDRVRDIAERLGFKFVVDHSTHLVYDAKNKEVPSKIYELDMNSNQGEFFLKIDERLWRLYRK